MKTSAPSLLARLAAGPQNRANRILVHTVAMTALVFLLIASGTGITFALWTSQDEVSGSVSRASLQVSVEANDLEFTYANHEFSNTGSFTVTNSTVTESQTEASYSVALGFTGDPELAAALRVTVWPASATGCAAGPSDSKTNGTWADFPEGAIIGSLGAGDSNTYCVSSAATTRDSLAAVDGSWAIQPSIIATMTVGTWSAEGTATSSMGTEWIYPSHAPASDSWFRITSLDGDTCVDVEAEQNAEGKPVIAYDCKESGNRDNQEWRFHAVDSYNRVISKQVSDDEPDPRAMAVLSGAVDDGGRVTFTRADAPHSLWQVQEASDGEYQLVAQHSGRCLVPGPTVDGAVRFIQSACDGSAAQKFALEDVGPVAEPVEPEEPLFDANARDAIVDAATSRCVVPLPDTNTLTSAEDCGDVGSQITPQGDGYDVALVDSDGVQLWNLQRDHDRLFAFKVAGKNCLAVRNDSEVKTSKKWCDPAQLFSITKIPAPVAAPLGVETMLAEPSGEQ